MSVYIGKANLYDVGSFTDELKVYRVVIGDGPFSDDDMCTCPAFKFHPETDCKHIIEARQNERYREGERFKAGFVLSTYDEPKPEPVDIVKLISEAFNNGLDSGLVLGRKLERAGR